RTLVRMAYFTPTILPMIAVANIWLFFYTPQYGLLEQAAGALGFSSHNWLGSQDTALLAGIMVGVWKEAGFVMIFYLAALQSMSPSLAEAAALEGASRWTFFRRVQFPLLMPTTLFVLINAVINAFRTVDHIIVMTRGGPDNATTLLLYYIYQVGFNFWDTTYAAALTTGLLAMLALAAFLQYGLLERRIHSRWPRSSAPIPMHRAAFGALSKARPRGCWRSCGCCRSSMRYGRRFIRPSSRRAFRYSHR